MYLELNNYYSNLIKNHAKLEMLVFERQTHKKFLLDK